MSFFGLRFFLGLWLAVTEWKESQLFSDTRRANKFAFKVVCLSKLIHSQPCGKNSFMFTSENAKNEWKKCLKASCHNIKLEKTFNDFFFSGVLEDCAKLFLLLLKEYNSPSLSLHGFGLSEPTEDKLPLALPELSWLATVKKQIKFVKIPLRNRILNL